jgi:hypothetical protein
MTTCVLSRQRLECALFAALVLVSRLLFRSHFLYDIDSVNFALGISRFDPTVHQPHPPGYFLYICLARLVNSIVHDPNTALVAISIAASCGAVVMIYVLALDWFGQPAARFAALLFLLSPLTWFHGIVGLVYIVEAFLSALAGYLCWRVCQGRKGFAIPAALVLGLGAGIRPSFPVFLAPLFLFSLWGISWKRIGATIAVALVAVLAWFVPMVQASGGFHRYLLALSALWRTEGGHHTVFNSSPFMSIARILVIVFIGAMCFGPAILLFVRALYRKQSAGVRQPLVGQTLGLRRPRRPPAASPLPTTAALEIGAESRPSGRGLAAQRDRKLFTWIWIAPGLLFFSFVFLPLVNSGYLLVVLTPVFLWLGLWASEWYAGLWLAKLLKWAAIGVLAAIDILIFLGAPMYCSYRSVRQFEANLRSIQQAVPGLASPEHTLIVGFDSHFLGYRHAGYYLPQYETVEYPKMPTAGGPRIMMMRNRDTHLLEKLDATRFTNFLLFPLPSDEKAYAAYTAKVKAKFPQSDLRTVHAGNHDFIMGPISDVRFLFPDAATVYTRAAPALRATPNHSFF